MPVTEEMKTLERTYRIGIIAVIIAFIALCFAFVSAPVPFGYANASGIKTWSVRVCKVTTLGGETVYTDLSSGERMTESYTLAFLISYPTNDGYENKDNFYFYESDTAISNFDNIPQSEWNKNKMGDMQTIILKNQAGEDITYKEYTYEPLGGAYKCNKYIYFKRMYTDHEGIPYSQIYDYSWNIIINVLLGEEQLGIDEDNIVATYQHTSGSTVPYTGAWINTSLRFVITTKWMEINGLTSFDASDELLFYSVDGKLPSDGTKQWIAMSSNTLTLNNSLQKFVYFKVANISQSHSAITKFKHQVNMDMASPVFNLSAVTTNINGEEIGYSNSSWTSNSVYFTITPNNNCLSSITYYYRTSTQPNYEVYNSAIYPCNSSVSGLKFMAKNEAGGTYYSEEYVVNIDNIKPVASLSVFTEDPDDSEKIKALSESGDGIYYANGKIFFNVYNKDINGNIINNKSPLTFYYAKKEGDGNYSNYKELTTSYLDKNNYTYYYLQDSILAGISSNRSYKFYIKTAAGLKSNEVVFDATLINGYFTIEVEKVTYTANAKGWASSAIPVYVTVPTDSEALYSSDGSIRGYTTPTTKYTFYYAPVEVANQLYFAQGAFHSHVDEGLSKYVFNLSASANSAFVIYAKNAAGKVSQNTYRTEDKIMIDTTLPNVWIEAYVKSEDVSVGTNIEISSGDWVNGRIYLTLKATIGISSIYAYQLQYVKDAFGNPIRDNEGKIVWLDNSTVMTQSESVEGVAYYHKEISLPDSFTIKMTEYFGFRIYTGSGVYTDIEFIANIDTSDIILESVSILETPSYNSETKHNIVGNDITLEPASRDFYIKLFSNNEQKGHYDYRILDDGIYIDISEFDEYIQVTIPQNRKGTLILEFYLLSNAVNYLGEYKRSGIYRIEVDYNTLNITINYSAQASDQTGSVWKNGSLEVSVGLQTIDEGGANKELTPEVKENYTYYYMLINYFGFVSENHALATGTWIKCSAANNGSYDLYNQYNFSIYFENSSFYGYLAISVCNEAGYRSSSSGFIANRIAIDNTTPDVTTMVYQARGENIDDSDMKVRTYFSNTAIQLKNISYNDRSVITYYYYVISNPGVIPESNPVSPTDTKGWTVLSGAVNFAPGEGTYTIYKVMLYAINELGAKSGGISEGSYYTFEFILDTSPLSGELSYSPYDGGYLNSATGLWTYQWQDTAIINLSSANSNTGVSFWYSTDEGVSYSRYGSSYYDAGTTQSIVFDKNIFPQGIMGTFTFKVMNRAGSEYVYKEKIYIAMDDEAPDFEIELTVNGAAYNGGTTEFTDNTGTWSSVDITIKINLIFVNVSGAKLTYKIYYYEDNTMKTAEDGLPVPNATSFSSYTILSDSDLFPNRSGDVVLEITATNKKKPDKFTTHSVRMRIDKTVPKFELKGLASSSESTIGAYINSGEWTNHKQVVISKSNMAKNSSNVTYTVTYEDLTSTAKEHYEWTTGNSLQPCTQTCTITVKAKSEAGLEYVSIFQVKIDTIPPVITFMGGINVVEGEKHYIDLKVVVREENIKICQYITVKGEQNGFPLDPSGYIISTSSVDNSTRYDTSIPADNIEDTAYRGYVKIIVEDYAGNRATFEFYMHPFALNVNNITLSDEDARTLEKYQEDLAKAKIYMESSRVTYFENLIQRLKDRINTLNQEINGYRAYLEKLAQRISYELKSDYYEMFDYLETYNNYALYGQEWIQKAIQGDASSKYYAYYKNLTDVFAILKAEMDKVAKVEEHTKTLPAINVVDSVDYNDVLRVFDEYNDLTADQKACFATTLYTKLLTLKKKCEILLLTDKESGISIDGNFTPGAKIQITEYTETSEYYNNAQAAILSVLTQNDPRAIVSINRISLTGATSQTATGEITVKLPIPEEWQEYIRFAVYKVTSDGTVSAIDKLEIQGDGKSIIFTSDELSTFVLCAKANIQATKSTSNVYGTILGLELDIVMIRNLAIAGAILFVVVMIVVILTGIRRRKFLNSYNRAYKSSRYRKGIQEIPYGNTYPKANPLKPEQRVTTPTHPY